MPADSTSESNRITLYRFNMNSSWERTNRVNRGRDKDRVRVSVRAKLNLCI
jgi:hypothetical protein